MSPWSKVATDKDVDEITPGITYRKTDPKEHIFRDEQRKADCGERQETQ